MILALTSSCSLLPINIPDTPHSSACNKDVCLGFYENGLNTRVVAINKRFYPVTVNLKIKGENIDFSNELISYGLLPDQKKTLLAFNQVDAYSPANYDIAYDTVYGHTEIQPDEFDYSLPLDIKEIRCSKYHSRSSAAHAIDFSVPVNTPVLAARSGIVIALRKDSKISTRDKRYLSEGNYIIIHHKDGTFSEYHHLDTDGVIVGLGEFVSQGQLIGYSGNTGFSTAPHLHFAVTRADRRSISRRGSNLRNVSIPIKIFRGKEEIQC